ncbi:hypothetical protein HDU85_000245 [Gaertneriomyces sp. JEL0708]|nr:hypothetical protein HDU85_000245 [Gaertneriomyces sp. JEL0708]
MNLSNVAIAYFLQYPPVLSVERWVDYVASEHGQKLLLSRGRDQVVQDLLAIKASIRQSLQFKGFYHHLSEKEQTTYNNAFRQFEATKQTLSAALEGVREDVIHADAALESACLGVPIFKENAARRRRKRQVSPLAMRQHSNKKTKVDVHAKTKEAVTGDEDQSTSGDESDDGRLNPPAAPVFVDIPQDFQLVEPPSFLLNDGTDLGHKFHEYQKQALAMARNGGLSIETNVHEILSLSSIIMIAPHQHSPVLLRHLSEKAMEQVVEKVETLVGYVPYELTAEVTDFLRKVCAKANSRKGIKPTTLRQEFASFWLSEAGKTLGDAEVRVVETFEDLCLNLPPRPLKLTRESEANFCVSYLSRMMLRFATVEGRIHHSWPNTGSSASAADKRARNTVGRAKQPDFKVFTVRELQEDLECGFGEVKPASKSSDTYHCNLDLIRVIRFGKQALDLLYKKKIFVRAVPVFRCVGTAMMLYFILFLADGIYVAYEYGEIRHIPVSRQSLLPLVDEVSFLVDFWRCCTDIEATVLGEGGRPPLPNLSGLRSTLTTPQFKEVVDDAKSRRRQSWIRND